MNTIEKLEQYCKENCHKAGECDRPLCNIALAIAELQETCEWKNDVDDFVYITACGGRCTWAVIEYKFCLFCGKPIKEIR